MTRGVSMAVVAALGLMTAEGVGAQPLGQFRWQLQPFCNVVTLNIVQSGGVYQLDGYDDRCGGAAPRSAVVGTAFLNPDGSVGMGFTIVAAPSGTPVHVTASLDPSSVTGTWHDSSGNAGSLVFTPGAPVPGGPRPAPRGVFPAGLSVLGATINDLASPVSATDAANRGYVDGVTATKANLADVSVIVPLAGAGSAELLPSVQITLGSTTFVTPRTGFLKLELQVSGGLACTAADSTTRWWLTLDGQPVRSSVRSMGEASATFALPGMQPFSLTGITATAVAAGNHTLAARGACTTGSNSGNISSGLFNGSVTVLPAAFSPLAADPEAMGVAPALDCLVQRGADGSERRICR